MASIVSELSDILKICFISLIYKLLLWLVLSVTNCKHWLDVSQDGIQVCIEFAIHFIVFLADGC